MRTDNNQKKSGRIVFISCLCIGFLIIIFGLSQSSKKQVPLSNSQLTNENKSTTSIVTTAPNNALTTVSPNNKTVSNSVTNSSTKNTYSQSSFTNLYGTSTTICAHPGCSNYIASSGDTNCCIQHSRKCLNCGKYIDEDAAYCISCIKEAASQTSTSKSTSSKKSTSSSASFTNKYGTPTTRCAHSGCTNYIASSGDTNCCTTHSRKCLNCGKYIDEDAMYCMDCIQKALGK